MNILTALLLIFLVALPGSVRAAQSDTDASHSHKSKKSKKTQKSRKKTAAPNRTTKKLNYSLDTVTPLPGSLQAMAKGLLEKNSLADRHDLEAFAQRHHADTDGVLAHLALGYYDYKERHFADARKHFEAAQLVAGPLRDYGEYYLALTEMAEGNHESAVQHLSGFAAKYPTSPLAATATLVQAENLMTLNRPSEAIALLLVPPPSASDVAVALLLGEAYQKDQQFAKAVQTFQNIYYLHATAWQASPAERHLRELRSEMADAFPVPTEEMRWKRAEVLYNASQWRDAESEYRALVTAGPATLRDRARVRIGACQYRDGDTAAALTTLKDIETTDQEADAERLYYLAAAYRRIERPESMEEQIQALGKLYPQSLFYERALYLAAMYYFVSQDPERSSQYFTTDYQQFPDSEHAAESHWKVAWRTYRERHLPEARALFEEHIRNYPASPQVTASIYWLGRTWEPESQSAAAVYYRKLVETFPNYYYGQVARDRLAQLTKAQADGAEPAADPPAWLTAIRRPVPDPQSDGNLSTVGLQHRKRAKLLESAWLIDLAIGELKGGIGTVPRASFSSLGWDLARLEVERGRYHVALDYAKRLLSGYFAFDFAEIPRQDWELLFPLPWWPKIKQKADSMQLDPYLVAGLIRQESAFNPEAVSRSNARGLMQLMPATARRMAKQSAVRQERVFRLSALNLPEVNVAYGTRYLRLVLDLFNGSAEEALAAYNAGEHRVTQWLSQAKFEEPPEFVESIPFTETREYVQAVLRNAALYRKLYVAQK